MFLSAGAAMVARRQEYNDVDVEDAVARMCDC